MSPTRRCAKCRRTLELHEFRKYGRTMNWCRRCRAYRFNSIATPVVRRQATAEELERFGVSR